MSLKDWEKNGWLRPHKTSPQEISDLFEIVNRDLMAAQTEGLTTDWKFGIAYNAALKLCAILLYAEGFRPENANAHFRTLQAMPEILGEKFKSDGDYLNSCRTRRNTVEYDHIDGATEEDAAELIEYSRKLQKEVESYLKSKYPNLLSRQGSQKKSKR